MLEFAGQDLTNYFPPPMVLACPGLVTDNNLALMPANFTPIVAYAIHTSGHLQTINNTKLDDPDWYTDTLTPDLVQYYKGSFVYSRPEVQSQADADSRSAEYLELLLS
jgi:chitin synthase